MQEQENYQQRNRYYDPTGFNTAGVMERRLDTESPLKQLKLSLMSRRLDVMSNPDGSQVEVMKPILDELGDPLPPLLNMTGIEAIMAYIRGTINHTGVQGNLKEEDWILFVQRSWKRLAKICFICRRQWNLTTQNYPIVMGLVSDTIYLFASRTVDNLERLSYGQSMTTNEIRQSVQQDRGLMSRVPFLGNKVGA